MPSRSPRPCRGSLCGALVTSKDGLCVECRSKRNHAYNLTRPSRHRFYGTAAWQRLRNTYARANPLCEHCQLKGLVTRGVVVDHKTPIAEGGEPLAWENLQHLCNACNGVKTAADRARINQGALCGSGSAG
jgi:5-methylcytosine-specific restriction protein A